MRPKRERPRKYKTKHGDDKETRDAKGAEEIVNLAVSRAMEVLEGNLAPMVKVRLTLTDDLILQMVKAVARGNKPAMAARLLGLCKDQLIRWTAKGRRDHIALVEGKTDEPTMECKLVVAVDMAAAQLHDTLLTEGVLSGGAEIKFHYMRTRWAGEYGTGGLDGDSDAAGENKTSGVEVLLARIVEFQQNAIDVCGSEGDK